ncbi:HNH endonuclease signature motif containing protein [Nostoc sp. NIES-2111]
MIIENIELNIAVDTETGLIRRLDKDRWWKGSKANKQGHLNVSIHNRKHYVHRLVWELAKGPIPKDKIIDHINGDPTDNRLSNLRPLSNVYNLHRHKWLKSNPT